MNYLADFCKIHDISPTLKVAFICLLKLKKN